MIAKYVEKCESQDLWNSTNYNQDHKRQTKLYGAS
jgi:hypothetical protein